jgi:hypothetical protein
MNTAWQVKDNGKPGYTFSLQNGTLAPGASVQVTITIASTSCPGSNDFAFSVPGDLVESFNDPGWNC